jgi:hypothetical protein
MENDPVNLDPSLEADDGDEIVAEYPIYLTNELSKYLYLFQYPMRSVPFSSKTGPTAARIKPFSRRVELDMPLDTRSTHYSTERGEDFAMGLNDKTIKTAYDRRMEEHEDELMGHRNQSKKKEEELLDKMTLTSIDVPSQTNYVVGVIRDSKEFALSLWISHLIGLFFFARRTSHHTY